MNNLVSYERDGKKVNPCYVLVFVVYLSTNNHTSTFSEKLHVAS